MWWIWIICPNSVVVTLEISTLTHDMTLKSHQDNTIMPIKILLFESIKTKLSHQCHKMLMGLQRMIVIGMLCAVLLLLYGHVDVRPVYMDISRCVHCGDKCCSYYQCSMLTLDDICVFHRAIPSHLEPLRPWLNQTVPEEVTGVNPTTCLVFLPLNQLFDDLPVVPLSWFVWKLIQLEGYD